MIHDSVMFATDACAKCGKRDVKLLRCGLCRTVVPELCEQVNILIFTNTLLD